MKFTKEVNAGDIITPAEIISKLGLKRVCQKATPGNPLCFSFEDENGEGFFDLASGEVEYAGGAAGSTECETYNYYQREFGESTLAQVLDYCTLVWGHDEDGNPVAYYEA